MNKILLNTILIFVIIFTCTSGRKVNYGDNAKAAKIYEIRDMNFYTEQYGRGTPLLLLHGNGGSINSMSSIIPYLSKKYKIIAVDSRAHGKSTDNNSDSLSFDQMADDMAALVKKQGVSKINIIGWSDGGIVGIVMALRHPDLVETLIATGANVTPDSTAFIQGMWSESEGYYLKNKNNKRSTTTEKIKWKYFMLDWLYPNISWDILHTIKCPTLIVAGDKDIINLNHTVKIFQNIPKANLWIVPNSGHATLIEHSEEFCKISDEFIHKNKNN